MPGASGSSPTSCSTTPPTRTPGCGSSSATPSTPTGPWTRCASSTSGTGSSPTSRLDAITYLYEREGTNCANLPETHAYLKRLRKVVDDLYPEYATDPRARVNLGIRRRLAPLVGNDRNQMELFTSLLLSLPGSPVLYYGDEIGMGDNVWLGDRNSVRTPMQWSPDRNGGFSR